MYAAIRNNHHRKDINKKSPDMFIHLNHVYAKTPSTELKLVLCCHLVDSGGGKSVCCKMRYMYIPVFLSIN